MPQSTRKRRRLVNALYYGAPLVVGLIGVRRLWSVTELDGTEAQEACVVGLLLVGCSVLFVAARRTRVRSYRDTAWEASQQAQARRLRRLEEEQQALRQDVHSRIAMPEWLKIFDRVEAHKAGGWVQLNKPRH